MTHPKEHKDRNTRLFLRVVGAIPFVALIALLLALFFIVSAGARAASAQEMPEGIEAGDGEVSINGGEVYAGNGCAKAGNVVAGDCKGEDEIGDEGKAAAAGGSPENQSEETTIVQESTTGEDTTDLEATFSETTSPEGTVAEGVAGGDAADPCPSELPDDAVKATVKRAVDGDTLELDKEVGGTDRVRLIGVDAPELEGEKGQPEPYAEEARSFTAGALEDEGILLQVGEDKTDEYGRLLAHVWKPEATDNGFLGSLKRTFGIGGPELFNESLLEEGYAKVLTIEPNDVYARCFEAAEDRAREEQAGLWGLQNGPSAKQYDAGDGLETTFEQTVPEQTVSEETELQQSTVEEDSSDPAMTQAPVAVEESPAEDHYGAEIPETEAAASVPDYQKCDDPYFLTGIVGDGERTKSVEVPGRSFLLAYRIRAVREGEDGLLLVDVYGPGEASDTSDGTPVERISYDKVGTGRTYVEAGPGTFDIAALSQNRGYHIAVYACAEDIAQDGALEVTEPPQGAPAGSSAPAEQAALPVTTGVRDAPVEETAQEGHVQTADFQPVAMGTKATGPRGLTYLPATGGAGLLRGVLGALLLVGGTLSFGLKGRGRRPEHR